MVTLGAARIQGDRSLAAGLANFGEVLGVPLDTLHTRRYALGLLPIGDAFLAWSKSARPLVVASPPHPPASALSWWWRVPLLLLFLLVAVAPWVSMVVRRRRRAAT